MKTTVITVSYFSFTESDNYTHTEQKTFTNRLFAQGYYEDECKKAYDECKWGSQWDEPEGERNEDCAYEVDVDCNGSTKDGKADYKVESAAYDGYHVKVSYEAVEVDVKAPKIFLFDRKVFSQQEADNFTWEDAHELAQIDKGVRHVWEYDLECGTFLDDFNRGCIDGERYYMRILF